MDSCKGHGPIIVRYHRRMARAVFVCGGRAIGPCPRSSSFRPTLVLLMHLVSRFLATFLLLGIFLLTLSGCDSSGPTGPTPRDRLVGTWVIEQQDRTYSVESSEAQTVLDPNAPASGTLTLEGTWEDVNRAEYVDVSMSYVRHEAVRTRDGYAGGYIASTHPVETIESLSRRPAGVFAVQLSDVYNTDTYEFQPDGRLEGEIWASDTERFPGRPGLTTDTASADALPRTPIGADPALAASNLGFTPSLSGTDTLRLSGRLELATQRVPSNQRTQVDVERTPPARLSEQQITYRFTANDSVFVSALANGDTLRTAGTWSVEGDTLRLSEDGEALTARIDGLPGDDSGGEPFQLIFEDPLCETGGDDCRRFYEEFFGLAAGTLRDGRTQLTNRLVPADDDRAMSSASFGAGGARASSKTDSRTTLLRGFAPRSLRPASESPPVREPR